MSDKNRNMNDINEQKTAEQQAFSEEIRRRLAEPGSGKPTLEEFKLMVYKDREKRRKKRNAMVACIVVACLAGFFAFDQLVPEVGADKNPKEEIVTEDGVIIEDGGWGSSTGEDDVWKTNDWENIKEAKVLYPQLMVPQYIPEGYKFRCLEIETLDNGVTTCQYVFYNKSMQLEIDEHISQNARNSFEISEYTRTINGGDRLIYILETENKIATISMNDGIIVNIWSSLSDKEIINIAKGLTN